MTNQQTAKPKKTFIQRHPKKLMFLLIFVLLNYPWFYFGAPIEGYVKDKETGEPIQGVVAVLTFGVSGTGLTQIHGTTRKMLHLAESVTDENGYYHFPWWVSKRRPVGLNINSATPTVSFYKIGYKKSRIYNARNDTKKVGMSAVEEKNRKKALAKWSIWVWFKPNRDPIFMESFENFQVEYEALKSRSWPQVGWNYYDECGWEEVPNYVYNSVKRSVFLKQKLGIGEQEKAIDVLKNKTFKYYEDEGCNNMDKVFRKKVELYRLAKKGMSQ